MTIWIDQPIWPRHGTVFAHLISDSSLDELHAFAARVGLHPRSFEGDHYDVPQERYAAVLASGATSTTGADVVRRLLGSGLRLRKRRGDRPVARVRGVRFPDGTIVDVDLVVTEREVDAGVVVAALVFVQDRDGRFAVVHTPRRDAWGSPGGALEQGESAAVAAVREVREETGLELAEVDIEPCAYERFEVVGEFSGILPPGRSYVQIYRTTIEVRAPKLQASEDDVDGWRWVDRDGLEELCGGEFWWPLVPRLFG